jgi:uncharacterized protein YozE (UPF0346 family)
MTFYDWLMEQRDRPDIIGDLAWYVYSVPHWPKQVQKWNRVRAALVLSGDVTETAHIALRRAWDQYRKGGTAEDPVIDRRLVVEIPSRLYDRLDDYCMARRPRLSRKAVITELLAHALEYPLHLNKSLTLPKTSTTLKFGWLAAESPPEQGEIQKSDCRQRRPNFNHEVTPSMPKVSFATKDAVEGGSIFQEGDVEITHAACLAHQFQASRSGRQAPPSCDVVLTMLRTDQTETPFDEPVMKYYSLGTNSLDRYHPGEAKGRDDQNPRDLGADMDTVGNCIYAVDGSPLNKGCKWMKLVASLEKCGFNPEILAAGYLPDLVGLRGHVVTEVIKLGRQLEKSERDPTVLVFDKVTQFPYMAKGKAAAAKAPVQATDNGAGFEAAVDAAMQAMAQLTVQYAGQKSVDLRKVQAAYLTKLVHQPPEIQRQARDLFKDRNWLEGQADISEWKIDGNSVSFP